MNKGTTDEIETVSKIDKERRELQYCKTTHDHFSSSIFHILFEKTSYIYFYIKEFKKGIKPYDHFSQFSVLCPRKRVIYFYNTYILFLQSKEFEKRRIERVAGIKENKKKEIK